MLDWTHPSRPCSSIAPGNVHPGPGARSRRGARDRAYLSIWCACAVGPSTSAKPSPRRADAGSRPWAWPRIAVHPDVPREAWPHSSSTRTPRRWRQGSTIPRVALSQVPSASTMPEGTGCGTGHARGERLAPAQGRRRGGERSVSELLKPVPLAADDLPSGERIVTIGTFDGVHRGHRRLAGSGGAAWAGTDLPVTGVTFEPVPAAVLRPEALPAASRRPRRSWSDWPRRASTRSW